MADTKKTATAAEVTVEDKLRALYALQTIDSKTDEIHRQCGELPLEVQDKEDELVGRETRITKYKNEIAACEKEIAQYKNDIEVAKDNIKKYEQQQMQVRNNRQFDSITKEIEFQKLDIDFKTKKIREVLASMAAKKTKLEEEQEKHAECQKELERKKGELDTIIESTRKDEEDLAQKRGEFTKKIEERLLTAYERIRKGHKNGLAIVRVMREACGGCFNKIPPQRMIDVATHNRIIVCEYCGRILIDNDLADEVEPRQEVAEKEEKTEK
jgi:hypothetical protein